MNARHLADAFDELAETVARADPGLYARLLAEDPAAVARRLREGAK